MLLGKTPYKIIRQKSTLQSSPMTVGTSFSLTYKPFFTYTHLIIKRVLIRYIAISSMVELGDRMSGIGRGNPSIGQWNRLIILMSVVFSILAVGCTSVRMTITPRSRMEQELLVMALDRAVYHLDVQSLVGKRVALELFGLAKDDLPFAREFINVWLWKQGIQVVQDQQKVDLKLKVLAKVLAVDQSETLVGTPEFTFIGIPIPAIAIYRDIRNEGHAKIQIYAFDAQTGKLVDELPESVGKANYDQYTVLFVINWTLTDLDKKPD